MPKKTPNVRIVYEKGMKIKFPLKKVHPDFEDVYFIIKKDIVVEKYVKDFHSSTKLCFFGDLFIDIFNQTMVDKYKYKELEYLIYQGPHRDLYQSEWSRYPSENTPHYKVYALELGKVIPMN